MKIRYEAFVNNGKLTGFNSNDFSMKLKQFEGLHIILEIFDREDIRSLNANAFYWGHVLEVIREYCGYGIHEKNQLHEHFKEKHIEPEIKISIDPKTKEKTRMIVTGSTAKMSRKRFTEFLDAVIQEGAELGCVFDDPEAWCAANKEYIEKHTF